MIESIRHMNCFVCGKEKKDFEVWSNKLVIGITFDSNFQNNDIISNMSDKSIICHQCIIEIQNKVKDNLDCKWYSLDRDWKILYYFLYFDFNS